MKIKKYLPGIFMAFLIAIISTFLGNKVHIIGASVFALIFGIILNLIIKDKTPYKNGLKFTSKKLLKTAIVFLGASLSIQQILTIGKYSLYVMSFTLLAAFGSGYLLSSILKINWKMSTLISAGTGICGGSAIAAISPTIDADESDITYAIAATFIFDILMIILFPIMGNLLGLSDLSFGLWTGTAVNDTSSVVAAGYAFSDQAGEFATIVKLTRTLAIIPIVLLFSFIGAYKKGKEYKESNNEIQVNKGRYLIEIAPWFILLFLVFSVINSLGYISTNLKDSLNIISKFLMAMALGAIGFNTDIKKMVRAGINPMILGFLVSLIVVVVSLIVQFSLGQI
ncbi:YeiH family putative sulfate export transporter [Clostridium sp. D2Q-14]|uniref:YeiH family protein n=1 Tax=Anaeromonas gelatinilytica TaxID=2683194 RepID=UPI00193BA395|nr:YeiH family protein [Anaeromonas gelatinilytica]MBS4534995.1 YeiH family putative sulfate export transporter [Anaeromonas gelatinilytica]